MGMGKDAFEIIVNGLKLVVIFLMMVQLVPILVWVERRGSAFIQNRLGPNRVGPLGLMQLLADAVKFLTKEAFVPSTAKPLLYYAAPVFALIPGAVAFSAIPMSTPISVGTFELFGQTWGPYTFLVQGYDIGVGIVFILGVSSLPPNAMTIFSTLSLIFFGFIKPKPLRAKKYFEPSRHDAPPLG
jgi:NADH-quinone oxidoreductase subunit H